MHNADVLRATDIKHQKQKKRTQIKTVVQTTFDPEHDFVEMGRMNINKLIQAKIPTWFSETEAKQSKAKHPLLVLSFSCPYSVCVVEQFKAKQRKASDAMHWFSQNCT